jgi:putative chitinase
MTAVKWAAVQKAIGADVDGNPGRETYGRFFAKVVGRSFSDPVFTRLGDGAAKYFRLYGIDSVELISRVTGEIGHESADFTQFEENLNYSAHGLANTWPGRYALDPRAKVKVPNARALKLHRRPQDIANDTYGLRMGNQAAATDNDTSPDGWQYRGRGPGMLTGKEAYRAMQIATGLPLLEFPELAADPQIGIFITLEFMNQKKMFPMMRAGKKEAERRAWNGGLIGFDAVNKIADRAEKILLAA